MKEIELNHFKIDKQKKIVKLPRLRGETRQLNLYHAFSI